MHRLKQLSINIDYKTNYDVKLLAKVVKKGGKVKERMTWFCSDSFPYLMSTVTLTYKAIAVLISYSVL